MKIKKGTPIPNTDFVIGERIVYRDRVGKIIKFEYDLIHTSFLHIMMKFSNQIEVQVGAIEFIEKLPPIKIRDTIKVKSKKKLIKLGSSLQDYILDLAKKEFVVKEIYEDVHKKEEYVAVNVVDKDIGIPVEMVKLIAIS